MGDHYIPQYYLKGFSKNNGKTIYVFDKTERRCFPTQIKSIDKNESEVTFPISSNIALSASWRQDLKEGYFTTISQVVKELNRRTCSFATRYVFHSLEEEWVLPLLTKDKLQLNRLI